MLPGELAQGRTNESGEDRLQAARLAEHRLERVHGRLVLAGLVALAADQQPSARGWRDEGSDVGELDRALAFAHDGVGEVLHHVGLEERVVSVAGARERVPNGGVGAGRQVAARLRVGPGDALARFRQRVIPCTPRCDDHVVGAGEQRLDEGSLASARRRG